MKDKHLMESLIGLFTIDKGEIKLLLIKKKTEPYKGYWMLPGSMLKSNETLEDNITEIIVEELKMKNVLLEQCHTFSDLNRTNDNRIIATSFIGMIDTITLTYKCEEIKNYEYSWFEINKIPKTAFDHDIVINKLIENLKQQLSKSTILKKFFPSDFTMPELQYIYEFSKEKTIDRRNFRKKLINLGYVVDTGEVNDTSSGRPAKLYRFNEEAEDLNIF